MTETESSKAIQALNELADEASANGNSEEWIEQRVALIKHVIFGCIHPDGCTRCNWCGFTSN